MLPSLVRSGGYIWKFTPHVTSTQRVNLRKRSEQVDANIDQIYRGLIQQTGDKKMGDKTGYPKIDHLKFDMPRFNQMSSRDKYTTFSKHSRYYSKPFHRVPKCT